MQNSQSEHGPTTTASNHHMVNVTGCLKKGSEAGGYYITDESGTTWELSSKTVDLSEHVNHVVSVAGHEMPRSKTDEAKTEQSEKSESGGNKYFDLKVAQLKMVSEAAQNSRDRGTGEARCHERCLRATGLASPHTNPDRDLHNRVNAAMMTQFPAARVFRGTEGCRDVQPYLSIVWHELGLKKFVLLSAPCCLACGHDACAMRAARR